MKSIIGDNNLTVLLSKPLEGEEMLKKAFFCPYYQTITTEYRGRVEAIVPSDNFIDHPQVMVRPRRITKTTSIAYSFTETESTKNAVNFWIQNAEGQDVRTYFCFNCQAPQLYFHNSRVVLYHSKKDVKKGESYKCTHPLCKESLTYLGMVIVDNMGVTASPLM